jgi:hypothetical protein
MLKVTFSTERFADSMLAFWLNKKYKGRENTWVGKLIAKVYITIGQWEQNRAADELGKQMAPLLKRMDDYGAHLLPLGNVEFNPDLPDDPFRPRSVKDSALLSPKEQESGAIPTEGTLCKVVLDKVLQGFAEYGLTVGKAVMDPNSFVQRVPFRQQGKLLRAHWPIESDEFMLSRYNGINATVELTRMIVEELHCQLGVWRRPDLDELEIFERQGIRFFVYIDNATHEPAFLSEKWEGIFKEINQLITDAERNRAQVST